MWQNDLEVALKKKLAQAKSEFQNQKIRGIDFETVKADEDGLIWIKGIENFQKVNIIEYLTKRKEIGSFKYPDKEAKSMEEVKDGITPDPIVLPRSGELSPYTSD
ncbi:MAG: hypothetical protein OIF32_10485, partial [Campylobacterales bacterium]|nr:hypothetical protein [Campylobacterales bacterium]